MSQLLPIVLKGLEGTSHQIASTALAFERSNSHLPAAREGGEGYAVPVRQADQRYMLKSYFLPTHERKQRTTFLAALQLSDILPTLHAAPVQVLEGQLPTPTHGDLNIAGYLAPFVVGETFEALLSEEFDAGLKPRLRLALQLCETVRILEVNHIAHGDLAMSNVMITDAETNRPNLKFIDFDGFYHPVVPKIPCSRTRGGRGFGQDGYRHRAYAAMDRSVTVTSDRAAMAALAFELVTLHSDDFDELRRTTVLDQAELDTGTPRTSDAVIRRWPAGWELLERAFAAQRPEAGPAPAEWRAALSARLVSAVTPPPPPVRSSSPPGGPPKGVQLRILERDLPERRVNLRGTRNTFESVSKRLAWLSYERDGSKALLRGDPPEGPVFLTRNDRHSKLLSPLKHSLESGDKVQWEDFVLEVG